MTRGLEVSKEIILNNLGEKEIMEYYTGYSIIDNKPVYKSPIRVDNKGKCFFKQYRKSYLLVDKADPDYTVDCFGLVMKMYNLNFYNACVRIYKDLLQGKELVKIRPKVQTFKVKSIQYQYDYNVSLRQWEIEDVNYWSQFEISITTLNKLKVYPVGSYSKKKNTDPKFAKAFDYSTDKHLCYCAVFIKNKTRVKLYKPLVPDSKWEGNINHNDFFGEHLLPSSGDTVYICSGIKDLACLIELGYTAIAPQSETLSIDDKVKELKTKFKNVIVIYDNDNTGNKYSERMCKNLDISRIVLPDGVGKDIADYVYSSNLNNLNQFITRQTKIITNGN